MSTLFATDRRPAPVTSSPGSISVRRAQGRVVVSVHGDLDGQRAAILEQVLSDLIDGQGNLDVLVDLREAAFADPVALDALRGAAEQARRRNAAFAFHAPAGAPHRAGNRAS